MLLDFAFWAVICLISVWVLLVPISRLVAVVWQILIPIIDAKPVDLKKKFGEWAGERVNLLIMHGLEKCVAQLPRERILFVKQIVTCIGQHAPVCLLPHFVWRCKSKPMAIWLKLFNRLQWWPGPRMASAKHTPKNLPREGSIWF